MGFFNNIEEDSEDLNGQDVLLHNVHIITEKDLIGPLSYKYEGLMEYYQKIQNNKKSPWYEKACLTICNAILNQNRLYFTLNRDLVRKMLSSDKNWETPIGLSNDSYKILLEKMVEFKMVKEIHLEEVPFNRRFFKLFKVTDSNLLPDMFFDQEKQRKEAANFFKIDVNLLISLEKNGPSNIVSSNFDYLAEEGQRTDETDGRTDGRNGRTENDRTDGRTDGIPPYTVFINKYSNSALALDSSFIPEEGKEKNIFNDEGLEIPVGSFSESDLAQSKQLASNPKLDTAPGLQKPANLASKPQMSGTTATPSSETLKNDLNESPDLTFKELLLAQFSPNSMNSNTINILIETAYSNCSDFDDDFRTKRTFLEFMVPKTDKKMKSNVKQVRQSIAGSFDQKLTKYFASMKMANLPLNQGVSIEELKEKEKQESEKRAHQNTLYSIKVMSAKANIQTFKEQEVLLQREIEDLNGEDKIVTDDKLEQLDNIRKEILKWEMYYDQIR